LSLLFCMMFDVNLNDWRCVKCLLHHIETTTFRDFGISHNVMSCCCSTCFHNWHQIRSCSSKWQSTSFLPSLLTKYISSLTLQNWQILLG
jgi:hypothetical protein